MAKNKHKTLPIHHICEYCGKEFDGDARAKYCSNSCRSLAWKARNDKTGSLRGIGQAQNVTGTRQNAQKIFRKEIVKHPEIVAQAQNMSVTGGNSARLQSEQPMSLKELLVYGAVAAGLGYIFSPPKKKSRRK